MRSDTQQAGRRRRGGRRHRGPRSSNGTSASPNSSSPSRSQAPKAPAKKLGFFERIIAFFKGSSTEPTPRIYGEIPERAEQPQRQAPRRSERSEPTAPKPVRKPELVEVTSPKLYVGNLSFDATESDLSELFSGVGSVQNSEVVSHRETQKSKGFAFVTMTSIDEAKRAVTELHDKEFMGRRLVVSGAKTSDVR